MRLFLFQVRLFCPCSNSNPHIAPPNTTALHHELDIHPARKIMKMRRRRRDALASCTIIIIEYIAEKRDDLKSCSAIRLRFEPETSCPQHVNPVSIPFGLRTSGMCVGIGCYETTSQRFAAKKKKSWGFSRRTFGPLQTSTYGKSSEHKNQRVWSLIIKLVTFVRISGIAYPKVGQNERTRVRESLPIGPHLP